MVIKQRGKNGAEDIMAQLLNKNEDDRTADSYFPLDVAYEASCGSNLLFRLEVQEYEPPKAKPKSAMSGSNSK